MVSFIVVAREKKKREEYVRDFALKENIDRFDITVVEKDTSAKATTQSIGIEAVKLIQKKIFFKPVRSSKKIVVIEDAQLLTPEAQNALLKVLEEPPANTIIIVGTETKETLLPTILSRCQLIELEEEKRKLSDKTIEEMNLFLTGLADLSIGDKLKHAEKLAKDKDKAIKWIENLIFVLREKMLYSVRHSRESGNLEIPDQVRNDNVNLTENYLFIIRSFQSLHTLLRTTNVNPRFAIEHTLLSL
jgi:DNA polymerase III delta prime subunit